MHATDLIAAHKQVPVRFTAAEFLEMVQHPPISEWVGKIELVDGEIVRMAPANVPHWNAQRIIFLRLQSAFAELGPDWIVGQEPTVRLSADTLREPDVAVLRDPDLRAVTFDRVALFLAIEVADSSLSIDLGQKMRDYAEAFVPHYWVVDLNNSRTHVMSDPRAGSYAIRRPVLFGEPIHVPGIPLTITVD